MSADGGLRAFLDRRFGEGKWVISETPPTIYQRDAGVEIAIGHHEYYDITVEYGYERLADYFGEQKASAGEST